MSYLTVLNCRLNINDHKSSDTTYEFLIGFNVFSMNRKLLKDVTGFGTSQIKKNEQEKVLDIDIH